MKPLDTLEAIGEYLQKYADGDVTTPPSQKVMQVYQQLYIQESKRQEGLKVEKAKLEKEGKPVREAPRDIADHSTLLDTVVTKINSRK